MGTAPTLSPRVRVKRNGFKGRGSESAVDELAVERDESCELAVCGRDVRVFSLNCANESTEIDFLRLAGGASDDGGSGEVSSCGEDSAVENEPANDGDGDCACDSGISIAGSTGTGGNCCSDMDGSGQVKLVPDHHHMSPTVLLTVSLL